ncbi:Importin subunit beta-3 [Meyerozyma guilliermondii]
MSFIPAEAQASLAELVTYLASADNALRSKAEQTLDSEWSSGKEIEMLLLYLAEAACTSTDQTIQAFCAVLFRRVAIKSPKEWSNVTDRTIDVISEPVRQQIRSTLLNGFLSVKSKQIRHKLADAISEVAKEDSSPAGTWNDLLPSLIEATRHSDASYRESAFRVFSNAPELIGKENHEAILPVFNAGFADEDDDVCVAACTAFVAFFRELPRKTYASHAPLLPNLMNSLPRFLQNGKDFALSSILASLIDLVELAPKMFKDMFPTIIEFCAAVARNKDLDSSARMGALELLTTFSEVSPAMCKKTPTFTNTMVEITLLMLTEVCIDDDDAAEWNNSSDLDDGELEPEYDAARQALDRVSLKLNGMAIATPLFNYLPMLISSDDWRQRQAALMALSSAAEGCSDVLIAEIPRILDLVLPTLQDNHPRVQYASCNALGQMSTDFSDVIQRTEGNRILPGLISKLTNKSVPRVQAHAAAALVNFSEAATKDVLEPYLDDLLTNLLGLLQSPKRYVQEQVLTTIAIIADAAETKFIKYYDTLMPLLTDVLKTDMGTENRMLKGKCIECATLIALAVGKEKFAPHCQELIQLLGSLQEYALEEDDPVKSYLEQGWSRICRLMGPDFLPYLPAVLPPLLTAAKVAQDLALLEEEDVEEFRNNDEWDVISISGKNIAVHMASLDSKVVALDLLRTYAVQLKGSFNPWVKEIVTDICIPALDFFMHDGVRGAAALTLAAMLRCSVYATGSESNDTLQLWRLISDKLIVVSESDPVSEILVAYYSSLVECINVLGPNSLEESQLQALASSINSNLMRIYARLKSFEKDENEYTEDVDVEDEEYSDEELLDESHSLITAIFKNAKSHFLKAFQELTPTIATFIKDENINVKVCGLWIVSDLLEYGGSESAAWKDIFMTTVAESLNSAHASVRHAAFYAVGVASQNGNVYSDFCIACLEPIFKMASIPDARADENAVATENAVAAIAKICHRLGASVPNLDVLLQQWVCLLPVVQDDEAAAYVYTFLSELVRNRHPSVVHQVPKVFDSVVQALAQGSIAGETAERVSVATRELLGSMSQADANALLSKYPSDMGIIKKWFS